MRITFVIPHSDMSGGVRVAGTYAERLHHRGHDVTVVSRPKRRPTLKERVQHRLFGRPIPSPARAVPRGHLDDLSVRHHVIDACRPVVADDLPDADVVVGTWWETMEWIWPLPPGKGAKVHFMQDYEVFGGERARVDATCRLPVQRIVIAQWVKDLMARDFGDPTPVLIPNAVDAAQFHAPPRGKQPTPTVGTLYTAFRNKGADVALDAYRRARAVVPELRLVMFGSDPEQADLPVPPGAEFFHRLPDDQLRDVYARCDAWLFPTRIEGFGLPILEAMACRTPVIATPAGAAPELLAEGGGVLVGMEDAQGMADALVGLLRADDPAWRAVSDAAHATAARRTWEPAVERFESALQQTADRVNRPGGDGPA